MSELEKAKILFDKKSCRFESTHDKKIENDLPLSVILQVTRHCNLSCIFCSEIENIPDPSIYELRKMRDNLMGVPRIYISGGEPLLRKDLPQVLELFYGNFIIGLPTNAIIFTDNLMKILKEKVNFVNIGLDGPRNITTKVRGNYDEIMRGIIAFKNYDIALTLCSVVLNSTQDSVLFTCQIADLLGAKKLKLITPIPKGNALNLSQREYLNASQANILFNEIKKRKETYGWTPKITFTTWDMGVEGYSLLVYPNGNIYAWPVYEQKDKVLLLGNIVNEDIKSIWARSPYKENHYNKYLGKSILVA